ncbi:hypothetical protein Dimus_030331 [Dionaea muscipula]
MEKFYDDVDEERPANEDVIVPTVEVPAPTVLVATTFRLAPPSPPAASPYPRPMHDPKTVIIAVCMGQPSAAPSDDRCHARCPWHRTLSSSTVRDYNDVHRSSHSLLPGQHPLPSSDEDANDHLDVMYDKSSKNAK